MATNQQRRDAARRKLDSQRQRRLERAKRRRRNGLYAAIGGAVVVVVLVVVGLVHAFSGSSSDQAAPPAPAATSSAAPPPPAVNIPTQIAPPLKRPSAFPAAVSCTYPADSTPAAKPVAPPPTAGVSAQGTTAAVLSTNVGQIGLTLDRALAPCTVNSFLSLARQGFYDNTPCHRLTTDPGLQVLQCGDPSGTGSGGPGYKYADETYPQLTYGRGYLAMANSGPNTNGSQFFMIYGDASALGPQYTVFGYISPAGLQVVDSVARAGSDGSLDPNPGGGKPNKKVTITGVNAG